MMDLCLNHSTDRELMILQYYVKYTTPREVIKLKKDFDAVQN